MEKEGALGGLVQSLYKLFPTNEDAEELLCAIVERIRNHENIKIHMPVMVKAVSEYIVNFDISVEERR